jgi:hypothetical protein
VNTASLPKRSLTTFYQDAFAILEEAQIQFLIGGAFAQSRHTQRDRDTKDLDIILRPEDVPRMLVAFERAGYRAEVPYPHWLAKIHSNGHYLDVLFGSGNGVVQVDDCWFTHAVDTEVLDRTVRLCPPEELLWSKAFVQERERFDGADVLHLLYACARTLDWDRLLARFDQYWPVLFSHLVLFLFAYPDRRGDIPRRVIEELSGRLLRLEQRDDEHVCYGTILSREQYLYDVHVLGYEDPRLEPRGSMTDRNLEIWTDAIDKKK